MRHATLTLPAREATPTGLQPWLWFAPHNGAEPKRPALKSEHFLMSATRETLLRSTTALNRISSFLHAFFLRMSYALAYARWVESMAAMTRQLFPLAAPMAAIAASFAKPFIDMASSTAAVQASAAWRSPAAMASPPRNFGSAAAQMQDWAGALGRRETAPMAAMAVGFATAYADFAPHISALFA